MGFTKIENADLTNIGVIGLPDIPGLSTAAMQAKLEETSRSVVIPKHNGLIDELEDVTASENIGMTPPTGRTGTTIKTVMDSISNDLANLESGAVTDAFNTIESGGQTFTASGDDTFKINAGSNVTITPLVGDKGISISSTGGGGTSTGDMLMSDYDANGTVKTAGGITSYVASAISGKADTSSLSTVATSGDYTDLSNKPTIPTKVSDLTNDEGYAKSSDLSTVAISGSYSDLSNKPELKDLTDDINHRTVSDTEKSTWGGKSVVSYSQTYTQAGQQIGTITIDGTTTNIIAPTGGGGGGGGAVDSVNNKTGVVVLELGDMDDVTFTGVAQNDAVVRNGSGEWVNVPLPMSALTGSYGDLSGKPSLATVATSGAYNDLSGTPTLATVATSGDYSDLSNTPSLATVATSGDYTDLSNTPSLATVATSGSYNDLSSKPSIPADLDDLSDVTISGTPTNGDVLTYNSTSSAFVPQAPSGGGHDMIPVVDSQTGVTDIERIGLLANGNDNYVINAYSAKRWSNAEVIKILTDVPQNADTVGKWEDDGVWENYDPTTDNPRVYREGWLFDEALFGVVDDDSITIEPVFSINKSETISWYAYRLDDEVYMPKSTPTGNPKEQGWYELVSGTFVLTTDTSVVSGKTYYVGGGTVAFKMNGAVQHANGVRIGVALIHQRTEVHIVSPIS